MDTDVGFHGGGGLIYGIGDNLALEFDVTHHWFDASHGAEFSTTAFSLGAQYRFTNLSVSKLVPYVGGGVDLLASDTTDWTGFKGDVDTVPGAHANGGIDYFILKQLALNADLKVVIAPDADIKYGGIKVGDFDPTSLAFTVGFRFFFN
jgi:outer membrane protein